MAVWLPSRPPSLRAILTPLIASCCQVRDADFFWNRITMKRALEHGAEFAAKSGDAAAEQRYRDTAAQIGGQLRAAHMAPGGYLIEAKGRQKDGAVIVGLNFNFDDPKPLFPPTDAALAATVAAYNDAFCSEYPINRDAAAAGLPGILYGRYPGDTCVRRPLIESQRKHSDTDIPSSARQS